MPEKSNGRLRSIRGRKIEKEVKKEELKRYANIKYVRSNDVANEDGRRGSAASQPTKLTLENNSEVQVPLKMKATIHGTNNVESPRSTSVQAMGGLIQRREDVNRLRYDSAVPLGSKGRSNSCQGIAIRKNGTKKVIEGVERLDHPSSKATKSQPRYIETNEDEGGDVNDPMSVKTNEVGELDGGNNLACLKDGKKVVVQLENMTCEMMKEQRETKLDIDHDDADRNLVDVEDDNGGDRRIGFPIEMNNEATIDRGIQSLVGIDVVMSKGRKGSIQEKTYLTLDDDEEEEEEVVRLTYGPTKKRSRYTVTSDDEVDIDGVDHGRLGVEGKESVESKAKVIMSMDCLAKVPMPFVAECVEQHCYCCSKPIDQPIWRGTLKIDGKEYTSLAGHLSTKSGEKVWKLSRSLETSVEVVKLSRSKVGPSIRDSSKPNDDNIGMYFFPHGMRHDENLDQLINEVMENDLVLQAAVGEAEMLIFPSCLLPERYKTFQSKHYLWALFKRREDKFAIAAEPLNVTVCCAREEENGKEHVLNQQDDVDNVEHNQEKIWMKNGMRLEKQGLECSARGGMDNSVNCKSPVDSTQQASASCVPGVTNIGFQLKAPDESKQEDARCYSVHTEATAAATNSAAIIAEATALASSDAAKIPANREQFNSSMEVQLGSSFCFVSPETPRIKQIIQELERENSLAFAMRLEARGAEPSPGSIGAPMQQ